MRETPSTREAQERAPTWWNGGWRWFETRVAEKGQRRDCPKCAASGEGRKHMAQLRLLVAVSQPQRKPLEGWSQGDGWLSKHGRSYILDGFIELLNPSILKPPYLRACF